MARGTWVMTDRKVTIVEVGPRDGFQSIEPYIPAEKKVELIVQLYAAGIRRMEVTAFVSSAAVPQFADASSIVAATSELSELDVQVLVPNRRHAERALAAGVDHIAFVLSVSEKHNLSNVRRSPLQSVEEYAGIAAMLPAGERVRLNVATAFDCPFDGPVSADQTLSLLDWLVPIRPDAEICLCDTTGRVTPDRVANLFARARSRFPQSTRWAFHGHDTYGLGIANVLAAWQGGVEVIDSSVAGLGGCPFAPGATGNVATEDVVWAFTNMQVHSGIQLDRLLDAACHGAALPGANHGGRVRDAILGARQGGR